MDDCAVDLPEEPRHEGAHVASDQADPGLAGVERLVELDDDPRAPPARDGREREIRVQCRSRPPLQDEHARSPPQQEDSRLHDRRKPEPVDAVEGGHSRRKLEPRDRGADPRPPGVEEAWDQTAKEDDRNGAAAREGGGEAVGVVRDAAEEASSRADDADFVASALVRSHRGHRPAMASASEEGATRLIGTPECEH
jgi:hypothetical protein